MGRQIAFVVLFAFALVSGSTAVKAELAYVVTSPLFDGKQRSLEAAKRQYSGTNQDRDALENSNSAEQGFHHRVAVYHLSEGVIGLHFNDPTPRKPLDELLSGEFNGAGQPEVTHGVAFFKDHPGIRFTHEPMPAPPRWFNALQPDTRPALWAGDRALVPEEGKRYRGLFDPGYGGAPYQQDVWIEGVNIEWASGGIERKLGETPLEHVRVDVGLSICSRKVGATATPDCERVERERHFWFDRKRPFSRAQLLPLELPVQNRGGQLFGFGLFGAGGRQSDLLAIDELIYRRLASRFEASGMVVFSKTALDEPDTSAVLAITDTSAESRLAHYLQLAKIPEWRYLDLYRNAVFLMDTHSYASEGLRAQRAELPTTWPDAGRRAVLRAEWGNGRSGSTLIIASYESASGSDGLILLSLAAVEASLDDQYDTRSPIPPLPVSAAPASDLQHYAAGFSVYAVHEVSTSWQPVLLLAERGGRVVVERADDDGLSVSLEATFNRLPFDGSASAPLPVGPVALQFDVEPGDSAAFLTNPITTRLLQSDTGS